MALVALGVQPRFEDELVPRLYGPLFPLLASAPQLRELTCDLAKADRPALLLESLPGKLQV